MNEGIISSLCAKVTGVPVMKQTQFPWHMQNTLRAAQDPGTSLPESARRSWSDGGRQQVMKCHLARRYSHSVLSLLFQRALNARADLEEQGGISIG